jgi:predicted enzyme related to lactoylglutathione lyase
MQIETLPAAAPIVDTQARQQQRNSKVVWFEIPVANMERAQKFYETIFRTKLHVEQFGPERIAVFPYEAPGISGCLIEANNLKPGHGPLPALNADPFLDSVLDRVEAAGGSIYHPYTELPEGMGCFARIEDTEGNLIGLHAMQ